MITVGRTFKGHQMQLKMKHLGRALVCAGLLCVAGITEAQPQPRPRLDLDAFQDDNGIIVTFKGARSSDPYFGVYPLVLASRAGLDVSKNAERFIAWGLKNQRSDGRFARFCKVGASWLVCKHPDSDDATLARWIELLYRVSDGRDIPPEWQASAWRAEKALMALRMPSGVYSVFPKGTVGYAGYSLFKDNVEVLSSEEALAQLMLARGDEGGATKWAARGAGLRRAIAQQFGTGPKFKRLALPTDYTETRFYPQAVAMPFAMAEGYSAAPAAVLWPKWLAANRTAWKANAAVDFPWGILAVASIQAGDLETAACWMEKYRQNQLSGDHWNVLEEVAAQVIVAKTQNVPCTNGF